MFAWKARYIKKFRQELWVIFIASLCVAVFIPLFTYIYYAKDLTTRESIMNRRDTGLTLLDRQGRPFFNFYSGGQKEFVPLKEIPLVTQQAVIAIEDRGFYFHSGFSLRSITRALYDNYIKKTSFSGGSTLTQQLVKNSLLSSQRSYTRKLQEIILAQEVERRYSKSQILEMYLNSAYFGSGAFGIEEAAQVYFGKRAKNLTVAESALLAGLLTAPSQLSPITGNKNLAAKREQLVLLKMKEYGFISAEVYKKALSQKLAFSSSRFQNTQAPHFALMARDQLVKKYGEEFISRSGFRVKTTIDLEWQKYAEGSVARQVENLRFNGVSNGAAVVLDSKSGEIRAMVGSVDWYNTKFGKVNMATSPRQPGSSFKPVVYAAAFEQGLITPATLLKDMPVTFRSDPNCKLSICYYAPRDYDNKFRGLVTVRRALANSLNIPSVEVMSKVGIENAIDKAKQFGITTLKSANNYGLSLVLGSAEVPLTQMTGVYATFANEGKYNAPTAITQITDKFGKVIYSYSPNPRRVVDGQVAYLISSILSDNNARREIFGNTLSIPRIAAVKTGTTENYRDAWTLGYTPYVTVGVWVGNNDGKLMDNIAGSLGAAPIWKDLMMKFSESYPNVAFVRPEGIITANCVFNASESARMEIFAQGTQGRNCRLSSTAEKTLNMHRPPRSISINPQSTGSAPSVLPSPAFSVQATQAVVNPPVAAAKENGKTDKE